MAEFCNREYIFYVLSGVNTIAYLLMKWCGVVDVQDALVFENFRECLVALLFYRLL